MHLYRALYFGCCFRRGVDNVKKKKKKKRKKRKEKGIRSKGEREKKEGKVQRES